MDLARARNTIIGVHDCQIDYTAVPEPSVDEIRELMQIITGQRLLGKPLAKLRYFLRDTSLGILLVATIKGGRQISSKFLTFHSSKFTFRFHKKCPPNFDYRASICKFNIHTFIKYPRNGFIWFLVCVCVHYRHFSCVCRWNLTIVLFKAINQI